MSERRRTSGPPTPEPARPAATEVVVDDSATLPSYSNFCRVTATPEEVILDFGLNPQPFATGRQDVKANQRIVMNFYTAKRLLTALSMTIQRHEGTFGSIELDVRRRAAEPAPGLSPARAGRPPGRRRVTLRTPLPRRSPAGGRAFKSGGLTRRPRYAAPDRPGPLTSSRCCRADPPPGPPFLIRPIPVPDPAIRRLNLPSDSI